VTVVNVENLHGVIADLQEEAPVLIRDPDGRLFRADVTWDYVIQRADGSWVETIPGAEGCIRAVVIA
jgi:hypothetical protein